MVGFVEDLRYGLRALLKHRGIAAVAVLSLGLGIGANITIFTLVNAILLRQIPVNEPGRLAAVHTVDVRSAGLLFNSLPNYLDLRVQNQVFTSLLLYSVVTMNLTGRGDPQLLMGQLVSANYFETLGVAPQIGRGFADEEDRTPGASPVVVISHKLWQRLYSSDPGITSKIISLNGRPFHIVGVAPEGFGGLNALYAADVWAPAAMYPVLYPGPAMVTQRRALLFALVGRLRPGLTMAQAEAGLQPVAQELERLYPKDNQGRRLKLTPLAEAALSAKTRSTVSSAGTVLLCVSALVLLIACCNVANLLLARASGRAKEVAVRLALGSGRGRLVRQLLTESVALALLGAVAGLIFARWARDLIWAMRPPMFNHADFRMGIDLQVFGYTLLIAAVTGILFGALPALRAANADLSTDLKERTGRGSGTRSRARAFLVSSQVAFSVVALVGAGLFVRSSRNAAQIDVGFDAEHLAVVGFNVGDQGYNEAMGRDYQRRALEAAETVPGVVSVALSKDPPLRVANSRTVLLDGQENAPAGQGHITLTTVVSPRYLQTVGIPLMRGRTFTAADTSTTPRVAVINEAAAKHFWPGREAVGQVLHFFGDTRPAEVVGIARNASYLAIGEEPQPLIYLSLDQYYFPSAVVYARTARDPEAVAAAVKQSMQPLERNFLLQAESVGKVVREALWAQRLSALLLSIFGGLAMLLAAIGIFGVVSYSVGQRVREFGVRMALGATPAEVQGLVLREVMRMVAFGVLTGLGIALVGAEAVKRMLFVVGPRDAVTFILVPSVLTLLALLACWIPARRITRIDPAMALRDE
jgi:macrolide transport system ATP-binding/permease protein